MCSFNNEEDYFLHSRIIIIEEIANCNYNENHILFISYDNARSDIVVSIVCFHKYFELIIELVVFDLINLYLKLIVSVLYTYIS